MITSSVNVELDVSTNDESVDIEAESTRTITIAISMSGRVESIAGIIESKSGTPGLSGFHLISGDEAYKRPKPPRK